MWKIFKRKQDIFQKLIEEQASITYEALKLLVKYLETLDPEVAEELSIKEKEADEVRRILIDELNRTFVTPFDREDIFSLSRSIDDVVDYADSTVMEMVILNVKSTPFMLRMANLLKDAGLASSTSEAIRMINQGAVKINGEKVSDPKLEISVSTENVYQVGKRKFAKVKISA